MVELTAEMGSIEQEINKKAELVRDAQQDRGAVIQERFTLAAEAAEERLVIRAIMELVVIMAAVMVECINMVTLLQY